MPAFRAARLSSGASKEAEHGLIKRIQRHLLNKLVLTLVFLILLTVGLAGVVTSTTYVRRIEIEIKQRIEQASLIVRSQLDIYLEQAAAAGQVMAERPHLKEAFLKEGWQDPEFVQWLIKTAQKYDMPFAELVDARGVVRLRTQDPTSYGDSQSRSPVVRAALAGSTPLSMDEGLFPPEERLENDPTGVRMVAGFPIESQEIVRGALLTGYFLNVSLIEDMKEVSGMDITVFREGRSVFTTYMDEKLNRVQDLTIGPETRRLLREEYKLTKKIEILGRQHLVTYLPLVDMGGKEIGHVSIGIPIDYVDDANRRTFFYLGLLSVGLMVLASVVGFVITRGIIRPVHRLKDATIAMAQGDLGKDVKIEADDEIGDLARSFNRMSHDLQQAFVNLEKAHQETKQAHLETLFRLAVAAEYKDTDTAAHIKRISDYSEIVGKAMGLPPDEVEILKFASPMHDVGKIGIPDHILFKPGPLTTDEYEEMKRHTMMGAEIFKGTRSRYLEAAGIVALTHHEKYDGSGYPRGLRGEEIHIFGRIVALVDAFDALVSERCYKKAIPVNEVVKILERDVGKHFDPGVYQVFVTVLDDIRKVAGV